MAPGLWAAHKDSLDFLHGEERLASLTRSPAKFSADAPSAGEFLLVLQKKKKNLSETMVLLLHLAFPIWGLELLRGRFPPADGEEAALPPSRLS